MKNADRSIALLLAAFAMLFSAACSQKPARLTRVMVAGESNLKAQPDTALIILSVVTQNQRALDAQQENARKSEAVIQAVKGSAGAGPEIKTSDYSLQPQNDYRYNKLPKIIGYEARNSVMVTIGELNNVGAVIDAATRAGANSVERVTFTLRENSPARGQTLSEATRQAMSKAESIAQALGGRVARVVDEQEDGTSRRPSDREEEAQDFNTETDVENMIVNAEKRRARTPVEAGSLDVRSRVQLLVEIEAKP